MVFFYGVLEFLGFMFRVRFLFCRRRGDKDVVESV